MPSHKNHQHLEKIKDAITKAPHLSEEEKANSLKKIEEWVTQDKASGLLYEELLHIDLKLEPILKELGLL